MAPSHRSRHIVLADPLPSKRPGPAARRLPFHQILSAALRERSLLSQWTPGSQSHELQLREALNRTLAEHGVFGYIREGGKLPESHPKPGRGSRRSYSTSSGSSDFLRANGTDWLGAETVPVGGNWSMIPSPRSRLYIFDLDVAKEKVLSTGEIVPTDSEERYLEARRSIGILSEFLSLDLRATYAQLSPSGGIHIFVLLPEGTDPAELPIAKITDGIRFEAGIPEDLWPTTLRGDIRSGASNGFLLMAGSSIPDEESGAIEHYRPLVADPRWSDFKDYRSGRKIRLLELTPLALERLKAARKKDLELKPKRTPRADRGPASKADGNLRDLNAASYGRLLQRLRGRPPASFHGARAQIYRALSCCGTPESIIDVWRIAGYDRDSARNTELSTEELLADIEAMDRRGLTSDRCGVHCGSSGWESSEPSSRAIRLQELQDEILKARLQSQQELSAAGYARAQETSLIEARAKLQLQAQRATDFGIYGKRKPRGFDYVELISGVLGGDTYRRMVRGEAVRLAGYRLRSLELALGYFGPLFGAGAQIAIAPASELMELFGWTRSQLREALRHLRSIEVISLERRQVTGRASGYGPGDARFFDPTLGRKLRVAWGASQLQNSQGDQAFLGGFFDYRRGLISRPDGSIFRDSYLLEVGGSLSGLLDQLDLEIPSALRVGRSVVQRYLSKPLARYIDFAGPLEEASALLQELRITGSGSLEFLIEEFVLEGEENDPSAATLGKHMIEGSLSRSRAGPEPGLMATRPTHNDK